MKPISKKMSDSYFSLDKEGRQQLRQASIQINEVSAIDSTITIINLKIPPNISRYLHQFT